MIRRWVHAWTLRQMRRTLLRVLDHGGASHTVRLIVASWFEEAAGEMAWQLSEPDFITEATAPTKKERPAPGAEHYTP